MAVPFAGHNRSVIFRRTVTVPWDDLDDQSCGDDSRPDWTTLVVTGPTRRPGARGHSTLEWTVTVQCRPVEEQTVA